PARPPSGRWHGPCHPSRQMGGPAPSGPPPGEGTMGPSLPQAPRDPHALAALCPIRPGTAGLDCRRKHRGAARASYPAAPAGPEARPAEPHGAVRTGFLGLGRPYYVPLAAFRAVSEAGAVLTVGRAELDALGYGCLPPFVA